MWNYWDFNIMNTLMLKIGMISTSRQPTLRWAPKYDVPRFSRILQGCTVHRDFIREVTAFQRNMFIFLFSTFQNLHLFAVILLVQSSMHLYESPSKLVAKLKLIEWVHSSNIQQRRLCSDEGKPCYKVCFTNNASAISELFTNSHLSEILS